MPVVSELQRRRRALIDRAGAMCSRCGISVSEPGDYVIFDFHHVDHSTKLFGLSIGNMQRSMGALEAEADKCVLLCSNCHRIHHATLKDLNLDHAPKPRGRPRGTGKWRASDAEVLALFEGCRARGVMARCRTIGEEVGLHPRSVYERARRVHTERGVPIGGEFGGENAREERATETLSHTRET